MNSHRLQACCKIKTTEMFVSEKLIKGRVVVLSVSDLIHVHTSTAIKTVSKGVIGINF